MAVAASVHGNDLQFQRNVGTCAPAVSTSLKELTVPQAELFCSSNDSGGDCENDDDDDGVDE